jgi:hypothetical protein
MNPRRAITDAPERGEQPLPLPGERTAVSGEHTVRAVA